MSVPFPKGVEVTDEKLADVNLIAPRRRREDWILVLHLPTSYL